MVHSGTNYRLLQCNCFGRHNSKGCWKRIADNFRLYNNFHTNYSPRPNLGMRFANNNSKEPLLYSFQKCNSRYNNNSCRLPFSNCQGMFAQKNNNNRLAKNKIDYLPRSNRNRLQPKRIPALLFN